MKNLPIASAEKTSQLLKELYITPNKSLGQNFLIFGQVAEKIEQAAQIKEGSRVVEIGPGLGALSERLAEKAGCLTLVELDGRLCLHLLRLFSEASHVEIINADALSFNYAAHAAARGWEDYQVVSNLPYYITSSMIRYLLLNGGPWQRLTLMVQKEVAEKLTKEEAGDVGPLALMLQYFGSVRQVFDVPPQYFWPAPEVQSTVIQVERWAKPPLDLDDPAVFERFLNAAYNLRRKTLINSLSGTLGMEKDFWQQVLKDCGISETRRAEQLSLQEFGALYALPQVRALL